MNWRTDKPTEKVIVAKLTEDFCHIKDNYSLLYLADKPYQHYCEYGEEIPYSAIEKWASLEEDKLPEGLEEGQKNPYELHNVSHAAHEYERTRNDTDARSDNEIVRRAFIAGAKWQAEKDKEIIELAEDHAMLAGMDKMKEEMMEKAVDGRYMKDAGSVYVESWPLDIEPDSVKAGDEVRLLVIPEEE